MTTHQHYHRHDWGIGRAFSRLFWGLITYWLLFVALVVVVNWPHVLLFLALIVAGGFALAAHLNQRRTL